MHLIDEDIQIYTGPQAALEVRAYRQGRFYLIDESNYSKVRQVVVERE